MYHKSIDIFEAQFFFEIFDKMQNFKSIKINSNTKIAK